jgi:hypothetical protein
MGNLYLSGMKFGMVPRTYTKETFELKITRLHVEIMITILGSILNTIARDLYDHLMTTFMMNKTLIRAPKIERKMGTTSTWIC